MVKGYVDGKLFITSDNTTKVKYVLEEEVKHNFAKEVTLFKCGCIFDEYNYINGKWVQSQ